MAKVSRFTQDNQSPVGIIVHSMLSEAQFQAINGLNWVLADGRSVAGSLYATLTGNSTVPDVRGLFLRAAGTNNSSLNGKVPSATLGASQGDATAKNGIQFVDNGHRHVEGFSGVNSNAAFGTTDTVVAGNINTQNGTSTSYHPYTSNIATGAYITGGDAETRPANIAVNIFIKIN